MANRLTNATSPYLLQHADNPVDWWPWGEAAFAEAARREVPVLVSIGYATCHWCHVMARESFSDPQIAALLARDFVAIKVDREEHPEVDAAYLAAAGAFTRDLGWPLTVFVTPEGGAFYATTYVPPVPTPGVPSFRQLLAAVTEAWRERRDEVARTADAVTEVLTQTIAATRQARASEPTLPDVTVLAGAVTALERLEDRRHGGFGRAPKFPVAPVLGFLLAEPGAGRELGRRTLRAICASGLRDGVEGGFFRHATAADWSAPHYERMLYDNALLLDALVTAQLQRPEPWAEQAARGAAGFLLAVLQLPEGGFASGQDSESILDGRRSEGGYYALDAASRRLVAAPALDRKVLTGWNGLAIGALARAGAALGDERLSAAARAAADFILRRHLRGRRLLRASLDGRSSPARAVLEDYGMLAGGLLDLALATGQVGYASAARELIDAVLGEEPVPASRTRSVFQVPDGGDPVLAAQGRSFLEDPSEGAYPSGVTACVRAAHTLFALTGDRRYREAAERAVASHASIAVQHPLGYGGLLAALARLDRRLTQLVLVLPNAAAGNAAAENDGAELIAAARQLAAERGAAVLALVTEQQAAAWSAAGFELFHGRATREARPTAYLCTDFTCRLPATSAAGLAAG